MRRVASVSQHSRMNNRVSITAERFVSGIDAWIEAVVVQNNHAGHVADHRGPDIGHIRGTVQPNLYIGYTRVSSSACRSARMGSGSHRSAPAGARRGNCSR